jgi:hypothetical protein
VSVIDRTRSVIADRAGSSIQSATGIGSGLLGGTALGALTKGIAQGPKAALAVLPSLKKDGLNLALGQLSSRQSAAESARKAVGKVNGKVAPKVIAPAPLVTKRKPFDPPPATWGEAPVFGGLSSMADYRELAMRAALAGKSWKNLFYVHLTEFTASKSSIGGPDGFNLFAVDAGFSPYSITGEAVPLGAMNMDRLGGTEQVELRITTFDDKLGSVKRWFEGKCDQVAHVDGTFGLPMDYLVSIELSHMIAERPEQSDPRLQHRWLMRPGTINTELSRRGAELEELSLTFVQFDPFMKPS